MVGVLVLAVAGVVAWKYRDSLGEYLKGNAEPTREKVDDLLRTPQEKSETFMDSAKGRISSGFGSARQKIHRPATEPNRESPTE